LVWTIKGFPQTLAEISEYEAGLRQTSKRVVFVIGSKKTEWSIILFFNGDLVESKGHISTYLCVNKVEGTSFDIAFKFGLLNCKNQRVEYYHERTKLRGTDFAIGKGYKEFISHDYLFSDHAYYVVAGEMTLACKVS